MEANKRNVETPFRPSCFPVTSLPLSDSLDTSNLMGFNISELIFNISRKQTLTANSGTAYAPDSDFFFFIVCVGLDSCTLVTKVLRRPV